MFIETPEQEVTRWAANYRAYKDSGYTRIESYVVAKPCAEDVFGTLGGMFTTLFPHTRPGHAGVPPHVQQARETCIALFVDMNAVAAHCPQPQEMRLDLSRCMEDILVPDTVMGSHDNARRGTEFSRAILQSLETHREFGHAMLPVMMASMQGQYLVLPMLTEIVERHVKSLTGPEQLYFAFDLARMASRVGNLEMRDRARPYIFAAFRDLKRHSPHMASEAIDAILKKHDYQLRSAEDRSFPESLRAFGRWARYGWSRRIPEHGTKDERLLGTLRTLRMTLPEKYRPWNILGRASHQRLG